MKPQWLGCLLLLAALPATAAGPDVVARADRALWPETIDSVSAYNRASRAEILVFAATLADVSGQSEETLKEALHIKSADLGSVRRVRDRLSQILLENWRAAGKSCSSGEAFCEAADSPAALIDVARALPSHLPERFRPWHENAESFHRRYAGELVRLAALLPAVTSEIDTFGPQERQGFDMADGHFLLSFDDGPSKPGGNSDALIGVLSREGLHGIFYVLGERLQERRLAQGDAPLQTLYSGQCVGLHGWEHQSHAKWPQWQDSVLNSQSLAKQTVPAAYRPFFRPPYGQRRSDSGEFFKANGIQVGLWNIDSQDWNAKVSADDAAQRVMTLMLLWRRGVVLFHDIHSKAQVAIPWVVAHTRSAGITWEDCQEY